MHTNHSITEKQKNLLPLFLSLFCYGIIFTLLSEILLATVAMEGGMLLIISALVSFLPVGIYLSRTPWRADFSTVHNPLPIRTFFFLLALVITLNLLASHVNFSPNHLSMIFSQQTGQSFIKYLTDYRMNKAKELLRCTGKRSSLISQEVGYKDPHYFSYLFKKTQGMTPTQYRGGTN